MSNEPTTPPALAGYPDARPIRDGVRLAGWTLRGFAHGAARRKSRMRTRVFSGAMFFVGVGLFPVLVVSTPVALATRRTTRYYMSPERDATLAVTIKKDGWHVADHSTAKPGTHRGRALRRAIAPALIPAIDRAGARLHAIAINAERAKDYSEDVPGLLPQGRGWPRGVKMSREPRPMAEDFTEGADSAYSP